LIEELERRAMLAIGDPIAMAASGLGDGSLQDFYKAQVGSEAGGAGGVGMLDQNIGPIAQSFPVTATSPLGSFASHFAQYGSSIGQLAVTTGANTPGIGSFALPIAGPSRAGGTGNPDLPTPNPQAQAADAAIESLFAEPSKTAVAAQDADAQPQPASERKTADQTVIGTKPSARRSWDIAPDDQPRSAGANR
jgi:hypothetical protein